MRCAIKTCKHNIIINKADFPVVKAHVPELSSARICQHKLCTRHCPKRKYKLPSFLSKCTIVYVLLDISELK